MLKIVHNHVFSDLDFQVLGGEAVGLELSHQGLYKPWVFYLDRGQVYGQPQVAVSFSNPLADIVAGLVEYAFTEFGNEFGFFRQWQEVPWIE